MAERTDPAFGGARGALAHIASRDEVSDDELRIGAKHMQELKEHPGWKFLLGALERRREIAFQTVIHAPARQTTAAEYAAVGGQAEAIDWIRFGPEVIAVFHEERDEANRRAVEATAERS